MAASWRNASSLMIVARNQFGATQNRFSFANYTFNYSLMMLRRSAKSSFFAKAYVFPGGAVETADFDGSWLELFAQYGYSKDELSAHFQHSGRKIPPLYATVKAGTPAEIGFRISAIRETFEETGVLICKSEAGLSSCPKLIDGVQEWQERVHQDPIVFLQLCKEHNLCPDIWSLFEWSNWLTPVGMNKRYDTIFYICVLNHVPEVRIDHNEITDVMWKDPVNSLSDHVQSLIYLAPPQVYELLRIANFADVDELARFARDRQLYGTERWLPIRISAGDSIITALPGDELYSSCQEAHEISKAVGGSTRLTGSRKVNRMHFSTPAVSRISCNVDHLGHKPPLNLLDMMRAEAEPSKL